MIASQLKVGSYSSSGTWTRDSTLAAIGQIRGFAEAKPSLLWLFEGARHAGMEAAPPGSRRRI